MFQALKSYFFFFVIYCFITPHHVGQCTLNLNTSSDSVQQSSIAAEVRVSEFLRWILAIVIICHILKLNCLVLQQRAACGCGGGGVGAGAGGLACGTQSHSLTFTVNAVARLTNFAFMPALGANSLFSRVR